MRSPAGIFALGKAFGKARKPAGSWPWQSVDEHDFWVDDPRSADYNRWWRQADGRARSWDSAEQMASYDLAVVVHHNVEPVQPGAGSAIFLHVWQDRRTPTAGCTAMERRDLEALLGWLDVEKQPLFVQLPGRVL